MSATLTIGSKSFVLALVSIPKQRRVEDPENKAKKKIEKYTASIGSPVYTNLTESQDLLSALLQEAETKTPGGGKKLADVLLLSRIESAYDAASDDKGNLDTTKFVAELTTFERSRSSGQNLADISEELSELAPELGVLANAGAIADGWKTVVNSDGTKKFETEQSFILRLHEVITRIENLTNLKAEKQALSEKKRQAREAKLKLAEAAKAAAALAVATNAASGEPAPVEPNVAH
jgi:hypothetical protein